MGYRVSNLSRSTTNGSGYKVRRENSSPVCLELHAVSGSVIKGNACVKIPLMRSHKPGSIHSPSGHIIPSYHHTTGTILLLHSGLLALFTAVVYSGLMKNVLFAFLHGEIQV